MTFINTDEMKRQKGNMLEELRTLHGKENRSTEDDNRMESLLQQAEKIDGEIRRAERANALLIQSGNQQRQGEVDERGAGFTNMGEFIRTVRYQPFDDRLVQIRAQNMGDGTEGGVLVPTVFRDQLMSISPQDAIFRPRATVIGADPAYPDAAVTMPALDHSGTNGVYAGVTVSWIGEGAEKPQTTASFTDISLKPNEVAAHIEVTDKLLRNASAADGVLRSLLRNAILAAEDDAFLNGNGAGKPLGVINAPATIVVNRASASDIKYSDLVTMYSKMMMGGSYIWVASQSIIPKLMNITDGQGRLIWQPNAAQGLTNTIFGAPVIFNERSPQLNGKGDLALIDASKYLIKDGAPLAISASEHVKFTQNRTVIKAFWSVDGQPWMKDKLTQENGSYQVSPFVVLDVVSG